MLTSLREFGGLQTNHTAKINFFGKSLITKTYMAIGGLEMDGRRIGMIEHNLSQFQLVTTK